MERNYFQQRNLSTRDKILSLDFKLIFLVLILGIISFFAMYSTEQGKFGYYTQSHLYRFFIFFILFIIVSFFRIKTWYKSAYLFYFTFFLSFFYVWIFKRQFINWVSLEFNFIYLVLVDWSCTNIISNWCIFFKLNFNYFFLHSFSFFSKKNCKKKCYFYFIFFNNFCW